MRRQALSIAVALTAFGVAFGVAAADAGLVWWQASGFSALVFTGSAQFAAVDVLGDGGAWTAAVAAGLLLNLRSLAFGVVMAPALAGPLWFRAAASQLMIDESMAVGSAQPTPELRRYGYLAGGLAVFVMWNLSTLAGFLLVAGTGDTATTLGLDAAAPASFVALLWPRLSDPHQRRVAALGASIALVLVPFTPPGIPILAATVAVALPSRGPRP